MRRLRLDFAHPQPALRLGGGLAGVLVLAAAVALATALVVRHQDLVTETESVEARIARLARAGAPERIPAGSRERIAAEVHRINLAAVRLTIPWEELFQAVEAATDRRIALLALQPNFQKGELKISGEADDFSAIRQYMDRLGGGETLGEVRLVSHEVVTRPGESRIRFELTSAWRPRT
jgi:Tfp pilus assembly protein PilN